MIIKIGKFYFSNEKDTEQKEIFTNPKRKVEFLNDLNDEELEELRQPLWTKFLNQFKK